MHHILAKFAAVSVLVMATPVVGQYVKPPKGYHCVKFLRDTTVTIADRNDRDLPPAVIKARWGNLYWVHTCHGEGRRDREIYCYIDVAVDGLAARGKFFDHFKRGRPYATKALSIVTINDCQLTNGKPDLGNVPGR